MLKIIQARLQQSTNCELQDVQAGFREGRGTRDQIANICWIIKKSREFQKNIYFCFIDYAKAFDSVDHNKLWNWCFWTVVLEETLESPLDCKEIQPVHPKGNQSLIFIGRTDAEAETPILWPHDVKNQPIGKDLVAGKDRRLEEKGTTEDEKVGWHHWLDGHEFD